MLSNSWLSFIKLRITLTLAAHAVSRVHPRFETMMLV